jgi:predicted Zn-dependent protease
MIRNVFLPLVQAVLCLVVLANPASAKGLIRDAEIERTLASAARPLLQKAGVPVSATNIFIVNDRDMNAFVAGGNNIFINAGLVMRLKSVEMLQAVIAHEIGHITGGHQSQRAAGMGSARTAAGIGILLGLATALAGQTDTGVGIAIGSADAAKRSVLANTRAQEASADQSGARYMALAGIDPKAALDVLNLFRGQELLSTAHVDPYTVTHPLSSDRISRLRTVVAAYKPGQSIQPPDMDYWYARTVAKFRGFMDASKSTLKRYPKTDTSEAAMLARAVAYHRLPNAAKALAEINALIKKRPKDPYYHELKGQILLESGKAQSAIQSYETASKLAPDQPLILAGLGHAMLATDTKANNKAALNTLKKAYAADPRDGQMLRNLALAYARSGNTGMASVVTAERYALASNFKTARIHAERAIGLLPQGSSGYLRADDIIVLANRQKKRK